MEDRKYRHESDLTGVDRSVQSTQDSKHKRVFKRGDKSNHQKFKDISKKDQEIQNGESVTRVYGIVVRIGKNKEGKSMYVCNEKKSLFIKKEMGSLSNKISWGLQTYKAENSLVSLLTEMSMLLGTTMMERVGVWRGVLKLDKLGLTTADFAVIEIMPANPDYMVFPAKLTNLNEAMTRSKFFPTGSVVLTTDDIQMDDLDIMMSASFDKEAVASANTSLLDTSISDTLKGMTDVNASSTTLALGDAFTRKLKSIVERSQEGREAEDKRSESNLEDEIAKTKQDDEGKDVEEVKSKGLGIESNKDDADEKEEKDIKDSKELTSKQRYKAKNLGQNVISFKKDEDESKNEETEKRKREDDAFMQKLASGKFTETDKKELAKLMRLNDVSATGEKGVIEVAISFYKDTVVVGFNGERISKLLGTYTPEKGKNWESVLAMTEKAGNTLSTDVHTFIKEFINKWKGEETQRKHDVGDITKTSEKDKTEKKKSGSKSKKDKKKGKKTEDEDEEESEEDEEEEETKTSKGKPKRNRHGKKSSKKAKS